jgi:hypothetical protein
MKLTPGLVLRTGFVFLALAIISYLSAIWSTELVSERFGLTGVTFMAAGLVFLIVAGIMGSVWPEPTTRNGDTDDF